MSNRRLFRIVIFVGTLLLFACVTINIYFPAEKVETAAGEIVEEIRGPNAKEEQDREENGAAAEEQQGLFGNRPMLAALVSTAYAQDVTSVSNPTIRELKTRMKARYPQLKPHLQKGVLKEGDDGYLQLGATSGLSVKDRAALRNLVSAENKDRRQLYQAVAEALDIDTGQIDRVAAIFAKEWQKSVR